MASNLLAKFIARLFPLGVSVVLVLAFTASLMIAHPQTVRAATLPAYRYTKTFDTSAGSAYGAGVATDAQGNIYVTGHFDGTVTFDGTGGSDSQTSSSQSSFLTKYNANGSYGYTKTFDTSAGGAESASVAVDAQGNIYITGDFTGTVVFDGPGGSDSQTDAGGNSDAFLTKYNANGSYGYTKTFDTSVAGGTYAIGSGVASDPQGNVYVAGYFNGNVTFDGLGGSDTQTDAGGDRDTFITKYNANGSYGYTKTFDTSAAGGTFAIGIGIATDSQGNVYVTGRFTGTVIFDGVGGSDSQTSASSIRDAFLTKYNANGSYGYTKTFDTSAATWATGNSIATDSQGNVYITGDFSDTVVFDGVGGSDSRTPGGANDGFFLTKYNANGSYAFTKTFDTSAGSAYADGYGIATDSQGNVYVAGFFNGTVVFDGTGGSDSQTASNENTFLTQYNPNGSYVFTKTFDSTAASFVDGNGVAADAQGNVYVVGYFNGAVTFDGVGGSDFQTDGGGNTDAFLTSFQAFTPSSPSPVATPASASASVPRAPNTGFGVVTANSMRTFLLYSVASLGLIMLATAAQKMKRAK